MNTISISPTIPECGCAEYHNVPTCFGQLAFALGLPYNAQVTGYFSDKWGNITPVAGLIATTGHFIFDAANPPLDDILVAFNGEAMTFWFTNTGDSIDARLPFTFAGVQRDCATLYFNTCDANYSRINLLLS